jgi:hypothetical protein
MSLHMSTTTTVRSLAADLEQEMRDVRTTTDPNDTLAGDRRSKHVSGVIRELDHRATDGISVTMLWNVETNHMFVWVVEEPHAASFEFEVAGSEAAGAFHPPYAYAAQDLQHAALAA